MKSLVNTKDVHLMTWETNPKKRNKNNIITFVTKNENIDKGDVIKSNITPDGYSEYLITEVLSTKKSSIKNHINYTVKTSYRYANQP